MHTLQVVIFSFLISYHKSLASFIFPDFDDGSANLLNYKFGEDCSRNETLMSQVSTFKTKFEKMRELSRIEVRFLRRRGAQEYLPEICEVQRDVAKTMTYMIQPIADFCVGNEKLRKEFVLNTLLLLEVTLDHVCGLNEILFDAIYNKRLGRCFSESKQCVDNCQKKSFDLYFWETTPDRLPTVTKLINGQICNYAKMLTCTDECAKSSDSRWCTKDVSSILTNQFDAIKRTSLCYKLKDVSEIIDSSSEDLSNVVT